MIRIALLGCGLMGTPMSRRLLAAGHPLTVWNRTRAKAEALAEAGAIVADSPAAAVAEADLVITGEGSLQRILVNFFDWVVDEAKLDGDLLSEVFADDSIHFAAKGTLEVGEFDDCEAGIIRSLGRRQLQYAIEVFLLNDDWRRLVHAWFIWLVEHRAISTHQEKASANRHNHTHHNQHFRFTGDLHWIAP